MLPNVLTITMAYTLIVMQGCCCCFYIPKCNYLINTWELLQCI